MSGTTWLWTADRKPEVEAAITGARSRKEAAKRLGVSVHSLEYAAEAYGFSFGTMLARRGPPASAPAPTAGVSVSVQKAPDPAPAVVRPRVTAHEGFERRLVVADLHIPFQLPTAVACAYALARVLQPHRIIVLGDLINNGGFSRHDPYSPEPERWDLAIAAARAILRSFQAAAPGAEIHVVLGNHDLWSERWVSSNPWAQGDTFDLEVALGTKSPKGDDRDPPLPGVRIVRQPEEEPLILGPVGYCHGNGGGLHFCKRYAETIGPRHGVKHLRVGHHHQRQTFVTRSGYECMGVGWLGDERAPAFHYAPPPRSWTVGCVVDDVSGDHVTSTFVTIKNGAAHFLGRLIAPEVAA